MKKFLNVFFAFLIFGCFSYKVEAASVNTKEVTLYYTPDTYREYLTQPSQFIDKFQLQVTGGTATYKVIDGESVTVSSTGLITPKVEIFYCSGSWCSNYKNPPETYDRTYESLETGDSTIEVKVGNETFNVLVHVINYATYNAEQIMTDYVKKNITADMTEKQKMEKIMERIAQTKYSYKSSSYTGLFSGEGADCIGDSAAILYMSKLAGIEAHMRFANRDIGAGNNHHNVAAILDNEVYVVDVMSQTTVPRFTEITKTYNGFSSTYSEYLQYDGYDEVAIIPENSINKLGDFAMYYGSHSKTIVKTVKVPKTITQIGVGAFNEVNTLTDVIVADDNPNYKSVNGVLFSKNEKIIYSYPSGKSALTYKIPNGVIEIADFAFSYNDNIQNIIINDGVETIGKGAFYDDSNLNKVIVLPKSVSKVGDYAIDEDKYLIIKNKDANLGSDLCSLTQPIYGLKNSTTEEYATKNNCSFGVIDENQTEFKLINDTTITTTPIEFKDNDQNKPDLKIMDGSYQLKEDVDYKIVALIGNTSPTNYASARIIGLGKYVGYIDQKYVINKKKIKYEYLNETVNYNGKEQSPIIQVLSEGVTIQYGDNAYSNLSPNPKKYTLPGTYYFGVRLEGKNYESVYLNYLEFTIKGIDITNAVINDIPNYVYDGWYIYPEITLTMDGKKLEQYKDYYVRYDNNLQIGEATITITGTGLYEGTIVKKFKIIDSNSVDISLPKNITIVKGTTRQLELKINPEVAINPIWRSLGQSIVRVDNKGMIEGVGIGTAKVTATYGNKTATVNVTVTDALKGDLDFNSKVEVLDAVEALYYYTEVKKVNDKIISVGDFNNNGGIDITDAIEILMLYVNE